MKKNKILLLFLMILILTSCGTKKTEEPKEVVEQETPLTSEENADSEEEEKVAFDLSFINTVDLNGNEIDATIFENKYTLVNIWGTFCRPCIVEMPDLQKLHANLGGDEFQVIGIISDTHVDYENNIEDAKNIIEKTGVEYINIIPNQQLVEEVLSNIQFVPTSFIVDSQGKIIGEMVFGARDYNFFESWVNSTK